MTRTTSPKSTSPSPGGSAPRSAMSSSGLMSLLHGVLQARLPGVPTEADADKPALLLVIREHLGSAAVVQAGHALRGLPAHPVLDAIASGSTPVEVLGRWSRLERFGHTRHRTRAITRGPSMTVEHFALDGGTIDVLDDLFIWGVLIGLLERAGFTDLHAWLECPNGDPVPLYDHGSVTLPSPVPSATARLTFTCSPAPRATASPPPAPDAPSPPGATMQSALARVLRSDLLRGWRVDDAARRLGVSRRTLQRQLTDEGTSFSEQLHRTRIDAACSLMRDPRLSLAEIAFCVSFSDQAHFSRLFHRYLDVPPSAYRELLEPRGRRP